MKAILTQHHPNYAYFPGDDISGLTTEQKRALIDSGHAKEDVKETATVKPKKETATK